ncbi:AhpC/TSA family protein [Pedobacter frigiditerrae]|uniref:AhpC/TSA family protein n=1 Tax=Pedobacter frigiditerrae TaxID=2530452 RepID=A0A4R0MVY0_9SPHI|nr:TlpA disulfide reductase family protein [Pedobacter frigiditerrae]TCC90362.1 AhpC/TSA family protein [Pedobacter frigiditerrae]
MLKFVVCVFLCCFTKLGFTQTRFIVNGCLKDIDTGKVSIVYNDRSIKVDSITVSVNKGKFTFSGTVLYPHAAYLYFKTLISEVFFISPGNQEIKGGFSEHNVSVSGSEANDEYIKYRKSFAEIDQRDKKLSSDLQKNRMDNNTLSTIKADSIKNERILLAKTKRGIVYDYAKNNPNSYVALWNVVLAARKSDPYKYENAFNVLSGNLKSTLTGIEFARNLLKSKSIPLTSNSMFPTVTTFSLSKKPTKLQYETNKYTLIDFWFSSCGPCIEQFPKLKQIFNTYRVLGFNIIGISNDNLSKEKAMLTIIKTEKMNWEQLWDFDGKVCDRLLINAFPTNFLIDNTGKIIFKDITPEKLKEFLAKSL